MDEGTYTSRTVNKIPPLSTWAIGEPPTFYFSYFTGLAYRRLAVTVAEI